MNLAQEETLHKLLLSSIPADKFLAAWEDEIGDPAAEVCVAQYTWKLPKHGRSTVYVFASNMVAVESAKGKWSAYATKIWSDDREYAAAWASFIRGTWVDRVPQLEGIFPTRTLDGFRGRDRTLKRIEGRLLDTTVGGGFVGYGRVSEWRGQWWSLAYPPLRGAI